MRSTLPSPNQRVYAPYKIGAMVEVLQEQGISPEDTLRGTGISPDTIYDAFTLTSLHQYLSVCENAIFLSKDPATPFEVGSRLQLSAYGMYGYALLSCLSIRDYFRMAIRYRRLATPPMIAEWKENPATTTWHFVDSFIMDPTPELRQFLIELQFSISVTHIQEIAGRSCQPLRASFTYPEPSYIDIYSRYLDCPCFFNQPHCELTYDSAILEWKPPKAHRITTTLLQDVCDRLIHDQKTSTGISGSVYSMLMSQTGDFPSMDEVAGKLNITSRTLRRQLEAEGTSFQAIMDDVRRSLATEYLKTTGMSVGNIAMLLGFQDTANFRRALKRWTGKSPRDLRE
ncbi:AraC family transcriptional regulator [Paraburkholderia fungorum]